MNEVYTRRQQRTVEGVVALSEHPSMKFFDESAGKVVDSQDDMTHLRQNELYRKGAAGGIGYGIYHS